MTVHTLTIGPFSSNCHLIANRDRQALVVDPGGESETIIDFIASEKLTIAAYLITHGHVDHVHALSTVHARHPAPIGMHPLDSHWAFTTINAMLPYYDAPKPPPKIDRTWLEGQTWTDAGFTYRVIETPGHSPGSVSFHFEAENILFSGDVLFQGSVGRTDLPGGDSEVLAQSLEKLKKLPDDTAVYSGHGPVTTIGREKRSNPFLR